MMFIDTNYFLRFLLKDINNQYLEAKNLFSSASEGKVALTTSTIVFFEIYWVLSSYYEKSKPRTHDLTVGAFGNFASRFSMNPRSDERGIWVRGKVETVDVLQKILSLNFIELRERQTLFKSLSLFQKTSLDLEDCYNIYYAKERGAKSFKTFDKKLMKEFTKLISDDF